eukprot:g82651.t1
MIAYSPYSMLQLSTLLACLMSIDSLTCLSKRLTCKVLDFLVLAFQVLDVVREVVVHALPLYQLSFSVLYHVRLYCGVLFCYSF